MAIRDTIAGLGNALTRPRPPGHLLAASLAIALLYTASLLPVGVVLGTAPYWDAPRGTAGNSWADLSTALSGYGYFVRGDWTLPLFQVSRLGAPDGTNIIFTDSIPLLAVLGRLLYRLTGWAPNPFGAWLALSLIGSGLSMTGLVVALGQRGLAAALMATMAGLCMPPLLARWGHAALMAQWEVVLALILYFVAAVPGRGRAVAALALPLAVLALWTQAYLFAMVAGILLAALAQAAVARRVAVLPALLLLVAGGGLLAAAMRLSGHFASGAPLAGAFFGRYSFNLLSPFVPQFSLLFPMFDPRWVDGTEGQYEGFAYPGFGVLFLACLAVPRAGAAARAAWRRHPCLTVVLLGFLLFATSNTVFLGPWRIARIDLPQALSDVASVFRASGRFVWPAVYLFTGLIIAAVAVPGHGKAGWRPLLFAAALQLADTTPLRFALSDILASPAEQPFAPAPLAAAIHAHAFVRTIPSFSCVTEIDDTAQQLAIEVQLLAARAYVATNTVYTARGGPPCQDDDPPPLAPDELRLLVAEAARPLPVDIDRREGCASNGLLAVCSLRLGRAGAAALLRAGD